MVAAKSVTNVLHSESGANNLTDTGLGNRRLRMDVMSGYVPGFDHDLFISYAHLDNINSEWVNDFEAELTARLAVVLGTRVEIWRDRKKLNGLDKFDEVIA